MNSKEIRQSWLDFFKSKNHLVVESKSLIPVNDPSLLWINSGVATLKDYFSGKKIPPSNRLTNSQKSIRTNDIENVGITARHHTFFEMLGNFSIGDYFKKEAIAFAVEYLLDVLKLDKERLYFTYYCEDLETKELWMSHGITEDKMIPGSKDTNFWEVGSGPCGPNTEIFYDRGEKYDSRGIELLKNDIENDRYIEIWNIVFSTYNSDGEGNYTELKQKNIDTGAGFERLVSIMQDAPTNYDTDLFLPIIHEIEKYTDFKYDANNYFVKNKEQELINTNFKIIADHMRTVVNAIADGAKPSNVGRGYILRRLLRRSIYKSFELKINEQPFLFNLCSVIKKTLPFEYDETEVSNIIKQEENLFANTMEKGRQLLAKHIDENTKEFSGELAFKLFETYGFPIELTSEILSQNNITINLDEFNLAKEKHTEASRVQKVSGMEKAINVLALINSKLDKFIGYDHTDNQTKILKLMDSENFVDEIDGVGYVILEETPFYATSGGQKHDRGRMVQNGNKIKILDVFKDKFGNHIHKVSGALNADDEVECHVDKTIRLGLERNHSGTHLLFCALRTILGNQIVQLGSDNNEERLTFDMPADEKPTNEQIREIEKLVRNYIKRDVKRNYLQMTTEEAKAMGAIMTLEEGEYMDPKNVRIVQFEGITADLCGGTHLSNSAKLENFKITNVDKKGARIYRIRAISSNKLVNEYLNSQIDEILKLLNSSVDKIKELDSSYKLEVNAVYEDKEEYIDYLNNLVEQVKEDSKAIQKKLSNISNDDYVLELDLEINGINFLVASTNNSNIVKNLASTLREENVEKLVIVYLKDSLPSVISIASKKYDSNQFAKIIWEKFDGKGGGNQILSMGRINKTFNIAELFTDNA
ncbi:alanine--tRNA ligase [Mycoplasma anatis]|uniref:Alanine--tRNA ligase n=1 Tax=Mycoplasmopsis anatis TaxID=171279 RepID=A0A9Q3QE12_9BACT|nr:alanine--tRNA ligase [Mycoplasmopsis anatis]MBW0602848.1 alanine--tRNA ligase [Mycoplasmopsis anatis]MBW0604297.1 alanine--tRNA ligase [Mycoplasmopsis anatis]